MGRFRMQCSQGRRLWGAFLCAFALLSAPHVGAAVVFDNLAAVDNTGGPVVYWDQAHPNASSPGARVGMPFTPSADGYALHSVTLPLSVDSLVANLKVSIHEDTAGEPAESPLEVIATDPVLPFGVQTVTLASVTHPILHAGRSYWIVLEPSTPNLFDSANDARYVWEDSAVGHPSTVLWAYYDQASAQWQPWDHFVNPRQPGLRVEAIPETSTIAMTAVGLLAMVAWRRWRPQPAPNGH